MWMFLSSVALAGGVPAIPDKTLTVPATSRSFAATALKFSTVPAGNAVIFPANPPDNKREFTVAHTGGAGVVRLTIAAGAHTALFQDVTAGAAPAPKSATTGTVSLPVVQSAKTVGPTINEALRSAVVAPGIIGSAAALAPAQPGTRTIRFLGLADTAANPSKVSLTLTLTDGEGHSVSQVIEVRIERPSITSLTAVSEGSGLGTNVRTGVDMVVEGFEHVYEARATGTTCTRPLTIGQATTRPTGGSWRGRLSSVVSDAVCRSGFRPMATFEVRRAAGGPTETVSVPITVSITGIPAPVRTVVDDTHAWFAAQNMAPAPGLGGTCDGSSTALGGGTFPVGFRERDGDATFEIRSGPTGTRCTYQDQRVFPPQLNGRQDGVELVAMTVKVEGTERCKGDAVGTAIGAVSVVGGGNLTAKLGRLDFMRGLQFDDENVAGRLKFSPRQGRGDEVVEGVEGVWGAGATGAMWLVEDPHLSFSLDCDPTAVNDHWVRVTVESLEFSHPPGAKP